MQGYRMDMTISQEENVKKLLNQGESILYKYDVAPLDYHVMDFSSPRFYISPTRLFFCFDEGLEVYDLAPLDISLIGSEPEFDIRNILLTPQLYYSVGVSADLRKLKNDEKLTRISITEPKQVPKYFLLREGNIVSKNFKTWAFLQLLNNVKSGEVKNEAFEEMLRGYFSVFNTKTMLYFVYVFLGYVVLKLVSNAFLPAIIGSVFDFIFGAILIFILYWLYQTVDRNLKKYERIYLSYSHIN